MAIALGAVCLLKLICLWQLRHNPLLEPDAGLDTTAYVTLARQVLAGDLALGPGLYYVSPLYIYFLAAGLATSGSFTAVRAVQVLLGTVSIGMLFVSTRAWFGERAAWVGSGLAALTGLFTFYECLILQASIDAFLTSAALLTLTLALNPTRLKTGTHDTLRRSDRTWLLASGVIFGVATLNRPNILIAAVAVTIALAATRRARLAAVLTAGLVLGMAPAAIRNIVVSREWSPVSSHGGLNFYIGNSEQATGFYHPIPGISPTIGGQETDARRVAERAVGHRLTDSEVSGYFYGLAWAWIRQHPVEAVALFSKKLGYVFSAQHIALPHSYPFYAYDARTLLRFLAVGPWLLVPLGLTGLVFASPTARRADYLVWAAFVPGYAVAVASFFVAERYRLPLLVPLCAGAGAAVDAALSAIRGRRVRALAAPAGVFAVVLVAANWPHGLSDGRWEEGLRMAQRLVILGRYDEADDWAHRMSFSEPRPGATDYGVGAQLLLADQPSRALGYLTKAHSADPSQPNVDYALGQALLRMGRARDAVPHLRRGFDAGVEIPMGGYELPVALQAAGDLSGAASALRRIKPADADDPEAWLRLGRLAAEVHAPEVADQFFRRAAALRPDQASARLQFGLNLLVLDRCEEAARELTEAARLDPRDPDAFAHLAYCELRLGRLSEARPHIAAALSLNPDDALAKQLAAIVK